MFKISRKTNFSQKINKLTQGAFCTISQFSSKDAVAVPSLNFEILHVNLQKQQVSIENPHEKTLKDLEQIIKKGNKFTTVEFKT